MNELNELELNKEVESIKTQIAIEYEKRNNIKPLHERFNKFILNKKNGIIDRLFNIPLLVFFSYVYYW